jgi:ADP-ribosylglycohydrolase
MEDVIKKIKAVMLGHAIGDALGVPVEFCERDELVKKPVTDMVGYGTYPYPEGCWSDDTSMSLAALDSLSKGHVDFDEIMRNFGRWLIKDEYTPTGKTFDSGRTCAKAIFAYLSGKRPAIDCGGTDEFSNGNGSLMRILPLAFFPCEESDVRAVSALTHAHDISVLSCLYYLDVAKKLLSGADKYDAVKSLSGKCEGIFARIPEIYKYRREEISSTGYVLDTLEAALWCLLKTERYAECVLTAVELGDDTDTVAAVAGGLAGIYYGVGGENGVPKEWISELARHEWIKKLCTRAEAASGAK